MCKACDKKLETLRHILSSCAFHGWYLYKEWHDQVFYQLAKAIVRCLEMKIPPLLKAARGIIGGGVLGTPKVRVLVDQVIPTDRVVKHNRPDIVVRLTKEERLIVFEVTYAWEPLVVERESEKWQKYQQLAAGLLRQWPGSPGDD